MVRAYLYDGTNAIKDGATEMDVISKWPDSPQWWGYDDWNDISPYALGHGLSLYEWPFFHQQKVHGGMKPQTLMEGMCIAVAFYAGKKVAKTASGWRRMLL